MRSRLAGRPNALAALVLAAGGSSRLGRPKQLLRSGGTPLILRTLRLARRAVDGPIIVVLGAERQRLRSLLRRRAPGVAIAANPRWRSGLASSLRSGLARLSSRCPAVLILLVDQPAIDANDLARLVAQWHRRPVAPAAASYGGRAGVPAILPRRLYGQIRRLEGDAGARALLRDSRQSGEFGELTLVEMPSAAFDIDTPADAARLGRISPKVRASRN